MFGSKIEIRISFVPNILINYILQSNSAHPGFFIVPSYLFNYYRELTEERDSKQIYMANEMCIYNKVKKIMCATGRRENA